MTRELKLEIVTDSISEEYKQTALKAIRETPRRESIKKRCKYVSDLLKQNHPEVKWCVIVESVFKPELTEVWYTCCKNSD